MKYVSKPVFALSAKRLKEMEQVYGLLMDASILLRPEMHDDKLRELVESAYNRAKHIHSILVRQSVEI